MDLDKFSVVSTNVEYDMHSNVIRKKYTKNVDLPITIVELKKLTDEYLFSLKDAQIPIPNVTKSYIKNEFIIYESEYCGKNIIELDFDVLKFDNFKNYIIEMLKVVKIAIDNNLYFDPHPKNFVFNDKNKILYVDFFPPYTDNLRKKRLNIADNNELEIIDINYQFFTKEFLAEHFCGDFINIDKNCESIFSDIYLLAKELNMVNSSKEDFMKKAKYIRSIEDLRLEKNIYLL